MSEYVNDGAILEIDLMLEESAVRLGNYNYSCRELLIESYRNSSRLHSTFQIILPQSYSISKGANSTERYIRIGEGFYLKNLFSEEYLSYDDSVIRDPLITRSATPSKLFCFTKPNSYIFKEEGPVCYHQELRMCSVNRDTFLRHKKVAGHSGLTFNLVLSKIDFDPVVLHSSCLQTNKIEEGFPFCIYSVQHNCYLSEDYTDAKLQLKADPKPPLIVGKFYLEKQDQYYLIRSVFFNGYIDFKSNIKYQLSTKRTESARFRLHVYSDNNSAQIQDSAIYCLQHALTGEYVGSNGIIFGLSGKKMLLNSLQLKKRRLDNISITGFMSTVVEVLNIDPDSQSNDFLKSFFVWTKGKLTKQLQLRPYHQHEVSDYELLQREFFSLGLVDKLIRMHTLKESIDIQREVVSLLGFLCKQNPTNITMFLKYRSFIVANFYDEHFDLSILIGIASIINRPSGELKQLLEECNNVLLHLSEKGQADDSHTKFLSFLKYTLALNVRSGKNLQVFSEMLKKSRHIQNFKIAARYEQLTVIDELILEIYIILAGKQMMNKLSLPSVVAIVKDTEKQLLLRKLCIQYMLVQYLEKTYKEPDNVIFESVEEENSIEDSDRQLTNYVQSLKEYCLGEIRVPASTINDGHIIAVVFLLYILCLDRLHSYELTEACTNIIAIVEEMEIQQQNYNRDYDFLSHSVSLLSRALKYFNTLRRKSTFREMLKSSLRCSIVLSKSIDDGLDVQKLRLQGCISKICYFVKLSGSNPKNSLLFLQNQDLYHEYTHNVEQYLNDLLKSRVVKQFDVEALQSYALLTTIRDRINQYRPIREISQLLSKTFDIIQGSTRETVALMKVQTILRCLETDQFLISFIKRRLPELDIQTLSDCFGILCHFVTNNIVNVKSLLKLLNETQLQFAEEAQEFLLYRLACTIVQNQLLRETQYINYVQKLVREKTLTQSNSKDFMRMLVEVTQSWRPVSTQRIAKYLSQNPKSFARVFNIHEVKGKTTFLLGTDIDYIILLFEFINNMQENSHLSKDFREHLVEVLPQDIYDMLKPTDKFFVVPTLTSYKQTYLQGLLLQILCGYNLFELLPITVAFSFLLISIQSFISCYRNLGYSHFELVETFFRSHPNNNKPDMDALLFAAKILTPLLKQSEDMLSMHEKQLDEDKRQLLTRNARILAGEIIASYEGFLTNEQYIDNQNIFNESFRILHRNFMVEPDLKFYYNYNSYKPAATKTSDEPLCKNIFAYLQKNVVEKSIFLHSVSEETKKVIEKEKQERRRIAKVILNNVGEGFIIETLLFCLQEATTTYRFIQIPLLIIKGCKQSKMIRAAQAILKLLNFDKEQTSQILLDKHFAELLVDCLSSNYDDIELLLVITLKVMKGDNGQLNLEAQKAFHQAFLGSRKQVAMKFIRKVLTDQLKDMIGNQGPKARLERHVEMRLNNEVQLTNIYIETVNTVECLCQSLNFEIKEAFGESEHKDKSILALLIELLDRSLGVALNNQQNKQFVVSIEKCNFIESTAKCVISLLHGPHKSNIKRALILGYQAMCVKVMQIEDSLATLQVNGRNTSARIFDRGEIQHIKKNEQQFYEGYLKAEIIKRENECNYQLIARLKRLAILSMDLMFEESIRYQPLQIDAHATLIQSNIVSLYEKLRAVYKVDDEELIRLLYGKQTEMNFFQKIISLDVFESEQQHEKQLDDLKPSLSLEYGIHMYNYLHKYYEFKKIKTITNAVYKHANDKRLSRTYNKNIGIFYQMYCFIRDVFILILMLLRRLCKSNTVAETFARLPHKQKMSSTIEFFAKNFQTIQIRMEDGKTVDVSFPLVPEARCFNKSIRRDFFRNMDYSSDFNRLHTFINHAHFTILRLELECKLSRITQKNRGLGIIVKYREMWKSLSFLVGFCQNATLLLENVLGHNIFLQLTYVFQVLQYVLATLLLLIFLFQSARLRLAMAHMYNQQQQVTNPLASHIVEFAYLISDKTFVYAFFYASLTAAGTFYPLLISLLMLDFFYRFRSTRFLLALIVKPGWSLINNIIFFVILLYIYSFIFVSNHDTIVADTCSTFLECLQIELWLALGMLGTDFLAGKTFLFSVVSTLQNILYLIFLLIYRALFIGIIINQKRKYRREDVLRRQRVDFQCFICGRSKQIINKLSRSEKGFKRHIELEHNLWNYISYLVYIEKLKPESMTAQQQYVVALWKIKSIDWLPYASLSKYQQ